MNRCTRAAFPDSAAEVIGLDLRGPPDAGADRGDRAGESTAIRYWCCAIRNLTDEQHIAFTRPFGDLQQSTEYVTGKRRVSPAGADDGTRSEPGQRNNQTFRRGRCEADEQTSAAGGGHTDGSFKNAAGENTRLLAARTVTRQGGKRSSPTIARRV